MTLLDTIKQLDKEAREIFGKDTYCSIWFDKDTWTVTLDGVFTLQELERFVELMKNTNLEYDEE